jgi:hypothetical protein
VVGILKCGQSRRVERSWREGVGTKVEKEGGGGTILCFKKVEWRVKEN